VKSSDHFKNVSAHHCPVDRMTKHFLSRAAAKRWSDCLHRTDGQQQSDIASRYNSRCTNARLH